MSQYLSLRGKVGVTIPQSQREGGCHNTSVSEGRWVSSSSWSLADSRAHSLTQCHPVNMSPLIHCANCDK